MSAEENQSIRSAPCASATQHTESDGAVTVTAGENFDWLIVCDHASNAIPRSFHDLGLDCAAIQYHIAWDVGASQVARRLALRLKAPLIESGHSRLLIDCNRYPQAADSIVTVSDGHVVRGNFGLTPEQRRDRRDAFFRPYHLAIEQALSGAELLGHIPVFVSVHTCTASMAGRARPWDVCISWTRDQRVARPVLEGLSGLQGVKVGDNLPYALEIGIDFTTPEHAMVRGLAHLQFELRQDRVSTADAAQEWGDRLFEVLLAARRAATWHRRWHVLTSADKVQGAAKWL